MSKDQQRGLHGGQQYSRKGDHEAHGVDVKAQKKLAQRTAQHVFAIGKASNQHNAANMKQTMPGSLNRRNH